VLDLTFEVRWDIVPVGDVADSSHWDLGCELVGKAGQLLLEEPDNVAIAWG